jgi:gamma-glutamyl:cysteine ligase YbdK (ATP-grasp superfamily)
MADANQLYVDPTPAYKPTLDFLQGQEKLANARYGKNKADISNIFGTLTSLTEKDAARIEDQFVQSIQQQQQGLAQRTAEVRATQGTARQAMQDVGAERGGGPMGVGPTAVDTTAEQGIAASNEYQTTWDALMNANKLQAQKTFATVSLVSVSSRLVR